MKKTKCGVACSHHQSFELKTPNKLVWLTTTHPTNSVYEYCKLNMQIRRTVVFHQHFFNSNFMVIWQHRDTCVQTGTLAFLARMLKRLQNKRRNSDLVNYIDPQQNKKEQGLCMYRAICTKGIRRISPRRPVYTILYVYGWCTLNFFSARMTTCIKFLQD